MPLKGLIKSKISIVQNLISFYFIILPVLAHIKIIWGGGGGYMALIINQIDKEIGKSVTITI